MIHVELGRQLMVIVNNKVGTLAEITSIIASSRIDLIAICAYAVNDTVSVMFVSDDNNEAKRLLEARKYKVQEEEIVLLSMDNKPGTLQTITKRIAQAGIDLRLIYGSVHQDAEICRLVMISSHNLDVTMLIKTEFERI